MKSGERALLGVASWAPIVGMLFTFLGMVALIFNAAWPLLVGLAFVAAPTVAGVAIALITLRIISPRYESTDNGQHKSEGKTQTGQPPS
jgi:hypothetical protein